MGIKAAIKAVTSFLPAGELTNDQLAEEFGMWHGNQIFEKTGVAVRHVSARDECASDLAVAAANKLFESGVCASEEIDFLVLVTQMPDYFMPTTACLVQNRLGLRTTCGAIDINLGCSGFIYGLAVAKSLVEAAVASTVLLITSDTYTKWINPKDRSTRTLFGDGAAATLVSGVESESDLIGPFVLGSDGRGVKDIVVPAGGFRRPVTPETSIPREDETGSWRSEENLFMNGGEVLAFTIRTVPPVIDELLRKSGLTLDDVELVIPHQANKFMLERLRAKLKVPSEKYWIDMKESGNTVSATIPIAIESARNQGRLKSGDRALVAGFGVGYSWGAAMIRIV
ncbi:MAG: 3-oxoacyl-ACP synthase [Acidobacteria bacterium]|nr:MAG: 3-oxoacyl-ACP synthase [Acidobacteriota bacterium]